MARSRGAVATTAVVADTVPLLTRLAADASWLIVNVRLPPTAPLVAVAVAAVGTDEVAAHTLHPVSSAKPLAASLSVEILVLMLW